MQFHLVEVLAAASSGFHLEVLATASSGFVARQLSLHSPESAVRLSLVELEDQPSRLLAAKSGFSLVDLPTLPLAASRAGF